MSKKHKQKVKSNKVSKFSAILSNEWVRLMVTSFVATVITVPTTMLIENLKPIDKRIDTHIKEMTSSIIANESAAIANRAMAKAHEAAIKAYDAAANEHASAAQLNDMFVNLAKELTGKTDEATVARVKQDIQDFLLKTLSNYPTKQEVERDRNIIVDKEGGVIYQTRMENGRLTLYAIAPYTNETEVVESASTKETPN